MEHSTVPDLPFTLDALAAAYRSGVSPVAVMMEALRRLKACGDGAIFLSTFSEEALVAAAMRLPPRDPDRHPLWGVPVAVKDNIDVAGLPTTAACPAHAYRPERSATVVEKLEAAGAIVIGKTNLDQFATGLVGVRSPYGVPVNPFDASRVPGGSSSGSAVAVARGIVAVSLGTDTAGSGRIPAAFNALVGLKPSLGLLSTRGVVPACRTLDCVSIFAQSVSDASAVFSVLAGYDAEDPYSRDEGVPDLTDAAPVTRIGVPRAHDRLFFGDHAMADAYARALDRLPPGLARVEVDMSGFFAVAQLLYDGPWVAERHSVIKDLLATSPEAVLPVTRAIIGKAEGISATATFEAFYALEAWRRRLSQVWTGIDVLCVPTAPIFPRLEDLAADPIGPNSRLGTYTNFVNLLDLSALAIPGPSRADGLPAGVTLIGTHGADARLARFALSCEASFAAASPSILVA